MNDHSPRRDIFDRLLALPILRVFAPFYNRHREVLLYLFFGALTTAISWGSFYLLHYPLTMNELLANVLSWIAAVLFAFLSNRTWVFSGKKQAFLPEMGKFFASRLVTLGIEELILFVFVTWLTLEAMVVKIAGNVVVLILNYVLSKFFVFIKK
ncbi:MAG: GtrA family protein [Clostridia bacterium]|nr:GtrA family protein [Clostridia bacterium]